jgi:hypothetical protein
MSCTKIFSLDISFKKIHNHLNMKKVPPCFFTIDELYSVYVYCCATALLRY